ncbi:MAG TPA: thioesterase family protein [Chloroflexota bacterium]|nr:thioesterase family protein [Chloroflexota bacterium]
MKLGLSVGATGDVSVTTTPAMAITFEGPPRLSVLSTPALLWQLEAAGHQVLQPFLEPGEASVGVTVNITHLAPTPIGMTITARATVTAIDRRRISFAVEAHDERQKIAEGSHDRFVVDVAKFAGRVGGQ